MIKSLSRFSLFVLLLTGCGYKSDHNDTKLIDFGYFTINVPKEWEQIKLRGEDSYVGEIKIDSDKVVYFDLGWYSNSLNEDDDQEDYMIEKGNIYLRDTPKVVKGKQVYNYKYLDTATETNLQKVRQNKVDRINIDGYKTKLVLSKQTSNGVTGVYIDSLWKAGDSKDRFMMSAYRLTEVQRAELLEAFKSLKFYQAPKRK
ncbi:hypothetical protein ACFQZX_07505 [Mucilaginibacter litoreus]|uniref:Lipoprotein n=1 Tax=Mucilaginibacter litoreus TaxID=1048221 RepID=A0ABW3ARI0_9SPHI